MNIRGQRSLAKMPIANRLGLTSYSAEQTGHIGERLGHLLQSGDVICLEGTLGAGKTCLTQGIGRGLGVTSAISSPTFIIVNEYRLPHRAYRLYHIDLYRVQSAAEACATGLEDYLYGDGICVIEWAERIADILPDDRLWVILRYMDDTTRKLQFEAQGEHSAALLHRFQQEMSRI